MCLGQSHNYPLRDLLRRGIPQDELIEAIRSAIELKPERHEFNEKPRQVIRIMSVTGG
jgi:cyclic pyranopterin phosphate synthase